MNSSDTIPLENKMVPIKGGKL